MDNATYRTEMKSIANSLREKSLTPTDNETTKIFRNQLDAAALQAVQTIEDLGSNVTSFETLGLLEKAITAAKSRAATRILKRREDVRS